MMRKPSLGLTPLCRFNHISIGGKSYPLLIHALQRFVTFYSQSGCESVIPDIVGSDIWKNELDDATYEVCDEKFLELWGYTYITDPYIIPCTFLSNHGNFAFD